MQSFGGLQPQLVKRASETAPVSFDFTASMAAAETISTQSVVATVYSGTDAAPAGIINGAATALGKVVSQSLIAGVSGVIYQLVCTITTSGSKTLSQSSYLAVVPPLV